MNSSRPSSAPFDIFPQSRPFLPDLKSLADSLAPEPASALIIVPNNRPKRYLRHLYEQERQSPPAMLTIAEVAELWSRGGGNLIPRTVGLLDQVGLVHECLAELGRKDKTIARLADMDTARFLPWGERLVALLDELLRQDVAARDIIHAEVEAGPTAAALLGALGRIASVWRLALEERGWTTPGLIFALAASVARAETGLPAGLTPAAGRPVLAAGFYLLTGTEDVLLRRLWREGARICLHSDPGLAAGKEIHWSCAAHREWMRRWNAPARMIRLVPMTSPPGGASPRLVFFAGYDCHSQLAALRAKLQDSRYAASTAVVLPDSSLLMPVLHHLPVKDVNVSMGYPLKRSFLCRLLENLFQLRERGRAGRYYWRDVRRVLRHPCLNMLGLIAENGEPISLREQLRRLERLVPEGESYVDWLALLELAHQALPRAEWDMVERCFATVLAPLEAAVTTADMAAWLKGLCALCSNLGGEVWRRFPLEAEALGRLADAVAPQLDETRLRSAVFPPSALHNMVRHIFGVERVPFEAEPITGVQVIGMLETRLLHFDHVFILEATEDKLPGNPAPDPLLPDNLRAALGLPDARERVSAVAHTVYRLCAGAEEAHFFWQEGTGTSELFDGKKFRSRFVEQLLWEEEQRRGGLIAPGDPPLETASGGLPKALPLRQARSLPRVPRLERALNAFLRAPLSATRLDVYLACPLRFVWECLYKLKPRKEPAEGDDPPAVGQCLHHALRALYTPWLNRVLHKGDISLEQAVSCFGQAFRSQKLDSRLPADVRLMLEAAASYRFGLYLDKQPEITRILALEKRFDVNLPCQYQKREYRLTGVIDRLDERDGALWLLDYKTGKPRLPEGSLWTDSVFFGRLAEACGSNGTDSPESVDGLMAELRERMPSLQLPFYLTMLEITDKGRAGEACIVALGADGAEEPLFGGLYDEDLATALEYCRLCVIFTLAHLERTALFTALPGRQCAWCPYKPLCEA